MQAVEVEQIDRVTSRLQVRSLHAVLQDNAAGYHQQCCSVSDCGPAGPHQ